MIENNINEIINNALISQRNNSITNENAIIKLFYQVVKDNQILIDRTNKIDLINNNGFEIDVNIFDKIFKKYINEESIIKTKTEIDITKNNLLHSIVNDKLGIILVLFDGNPYTLLELILLGILTHNTMIFSYSGYMFGTNELLLTFIQSVLEKNNYNKNMFVEIINVEEKELFKNFKTIDKTIIIGNNEFISTNIKKCTTETLISGYKNYDLYIENENDLDLINKIVNTKENLNIYINNDVDLEIKNAIYVNDLDEAITLINYNSSKYSSAIFTNNKENASIFLKNIKSKYVMVNTSPTIEQSLDIKQMDLINQKTIIVPKSHE